MVSGQQAEEAPAAQRTLPACPQAAPHGADSRFPSTPSACPIPPLALTVTWLDTAGGGEHASQHLGCSVAEVRRQQAWTASCGSDASWSREPSLRAGAGQHGERSCSFWLKPLPDDCSLMASAGLSPPGAACTRGACPQHAQHARSSAHLQKVVMVETSREGSVQLPGPPALLPPSAVGAVAFAVPFAVRLTPGKSPRMP